ncbi:phosphatidylinositol-3,4,5-trisphosphate 3-phosphatase [Caerostris darwini]|uniref:Phosphatidylinositol-3,4,5-trisphosphate 3-phosphatase n=1 Tax=Caerostris darwini TaxID=1538125 RepID=A0AAV4MPF7_9ARAC|nr:phosphatidylinositol-3,4,5-trisphosphate 3-phosphatase [Caerostris darwini]
MRCLATQAITQQQILMDAGLVTAKTIKASAATIKKAAEAVSDAENQADYKSEADVLEVMVLNCPILHGDVKLKFQCSSRDYLDNPHKTKTWKVFREKLSIELLFSPPDDQLDIPLN